MSLQFVIGGSGAGKSQYIYEKVIGEAALHPQTTYYIIVPEQFTMQTQKTLVEAHPDGGILNIDILSFERLAYRIFEEVGGDNRRLLEDTGKSMVLQKIARQYKKELPYLGSQMQKPGYLDEVKSLLSEFMLYDVKEEELCSMLEAARDRHLLWMKLKDVAVMYRGFREYLEGHYMTGEEILDVLVKALPLSEKIKGSVLVLDGFTGFTPVQNKALRELLSLCSKVYVTVTMDAGETAFVQGKSHQLFYMSQKMLHTLSSLTKEIEDPVFIFHGEHSRFAHAPALGFLEKNLFRYRRAVYREAQEEIRIFCAGTPRKELEEAARRMKRLVREKGYCYGEIAVITGNLEEYGSLAEQVFKEAEIPYFLDEKHSVLMNPFVEYLRAALEMVLRGFSYEGVFRYLRCGMSDVERADADQLENYVLALGIRGYGRWKEKWIRIYPGMRPEALQKINGIREQFIAKVDGLAQGFSGGKKTVLEFCRCLYTFVVNSRIQEKLKLRELDFRARGDKAMEKEYGQIYGIVMQLFDKMAEILGEETVSGQEFQQLLETGMAKAQVALIPPSMDQVLIGDMERTRLKDVRALFFVGVNEGNIPKNTDSGGILTEMEREFFESQGVELAPGPKELMNMQRFYLYLNLTKPSELLCLSYSQSNGKGEAVSPAYLIGNIRNLYPALETTYIRDGSDPLDEIETPGTSLDYFLDGLKDGWREDADPVFQELYSWYLRSPRYRTIVQKLVSAAFERRPADCISKSVANVLYGKVSPQSATRMEQFAACAFAHFLQYGLKLTERAEYEFRAADMGNVIHQALEKFARKVREAGMEWRDLDPQVSDAFVEECLSDISGDYGNTVLKSSARNAYMIRRTARILKRTVWALREQLAHGNFSPEGFEVSIGGGRIDRLDVLKENGKVYIKIIDYKTGNTAFNLLELYHGLQMQLVIYMDAAIQAEREKEPDMDVEPAGIFYYNVSDPLVQASLDIDEEELFPQLLKKLKMNGLVRADSELALKMDSTLASLPVSINKDGSFGRRSSVAGREQFEILDRFVKKKIEELRGAILDGQAGMEPYELGEKNACTFCPYSSACGFDRKIPGHAYRRLRTFSDSELWDAFAGEVQ